MPVHIHLHDGGPGSGRKPGSGSINSPAAHAQRAANRQAGENRAGYKASMQRQGKPVKPQFQQALSTAVKNIKAERPKKAEDPEKAYQRRLRSFARGDSVAQFFDSAGLAPPIKAKESEPDKDLSEVAASKKEGEYRSGPFDNLVHSEDGGPGSGPRKGGGREAGSRGYVAGRVGQHKIIEGVGTRGGQWAAHGRGETKWFKKREHAEAHARASSKDSGTSEGAKKAAATRKAHGGGGGSSSGGGVHSGIHEVAQSHGWSGSNRTTRGGSART